jgi:hypothetical protein
MENFSENRRRGRPRVLSIEPENGCRRAGGMYQHASRRGNLNEFYMYKAFGALWPDGEDAGKQAFDWLRTGKRLKLTILTELGRLRDPDCIRRNARIICEQKMRTREAVVKLRGLRTERKTGSIDGLCSELLAHLDDYSLRHPEFTVEQFLEAIRLLRAAISI